VLYFGICNSCSNKITQISPTLLKSKPVVIIFVQIIIFAYLSFSNASFLSLLFFITSVSKRKTKCCHKDISSGLNKAFKFFSICIVQTHTFCNSFVPHLSHFRGIFLLKLQTWQAIKSLCRLREASQFGHLYNRLHFEQIREE
jgi:hypothetical protein